MSSIVQNDTSPIIVYLVLSSDHVTPATGKTLTVTTSKNGAAFAAFGGTSSELGNGFYKLTPVTADVGTLGDLAIRATAASCDDWTDVRRVVQAGAAAADWTSTRAGKIDTIDTNATAIKAKTDNLPPDPADASDIAAAFAAVPAAVRTNLATELGRIDATISSRALASGATLTSGERAAVAAAILAAVIETNGATTLTVQDSLQLLAALTGGKVSGIVAGTGAQTFTVRSATDLQTIATVTGDDLGNRSAIVLTIP